MKKFLVIFFCIISIWIEGKSITSELPKVLVSVPPYQYLVEKIAGKTLEIQLLVPPGANAHLFEPIPKEIEKMLNADVWMRLGDPFEKKLAKVLKEKNPELAIVELWKDIELLGHEHTHEGHSHEDEKDFHLWLSPKLAKKQAEKMAAQLINLYPQNKELYLKNLDLLLIELSELDQKISTLLEPLKGKAILVSHPAFGYFCKDYGLIQIPIEFEGKEPRPRQISQILKQIETLKIKTVLTQAQYSNKGAELIGQKLHLPIFLVDPYSMDYSKNLLHIAEVISRE
ncbi:MAG TPA: zinc ABC transporter substrate-binding protein [Rhabdochlamydiaceae bacterium]|nr:zinc ABC transporter substrate-binding protein [Rhabdochlamydiaceae bacterium]